MPGERKVGKTGDVSVDPAEDDPAQAYAGRSDDASRHGDADCLVAGDCDVHKAGNFAVSKSKC